MIRLEVVDTAKPGTDRLGVMVCGAPIDTRLVADGRGLGIGILDGVVAVTANVGVVAPDLPGRLGV